MYIRHTGIVTEVVKKQGGYWCVTVKANYFLTDRYIKFKTKPVIGAVIVEEGMKVFKGDWIE